MRLAMAIMALLMVVISARLLQLQGVDGQAYAAQGADTRLRTKVLPASRGDIYDINGTTLAYSVEARLLYADPALVNPDQRPAIATLLAEKLGVPYSDAMLALTAKGRYSVLARDVDPELAVEITTATIDGAPITGIVAERQPKRVYPAGSVAGQIVGFIGRDGAGLAGIEQSMEETLAGTDGTLTYEASPSGAIIPAGIQKETPAVTGDSITLTLDADLQYLVQQAVDAHQAGSGATTTSAVVLDAKTGQVVAMYATPGYDAAHPGKSDPAALGNPAVSEVLEPGSINKVTTVGPALNEGLVKPETVFEVDDEMPVADVIVHDAWNHEPIDFTTTGILAKSSNVGTLMINQKIDKNLYVEYLHKFGIGTRTGIELPSESPGILAPRDKWSGSQVGNVPIGQGVSMTPLQMASIYQAIANDGVRIPPRIISSVTTADGASVAQPAPSPVTVMSADAADELRGMLEAVTGDGTGKGAKIAGYRIGGKTGTGQRANPDCGCYSGGGYYHTFVGMAPIEDPKYVIAIAITDPHVAVQGGASPLFGTLMSQILQSKGVPPSPDPSPKYRLTADE